MHVENEGTFLLNLKVTLSKLMENAFPGTYQNHSLLTV